MYEGSHGCGPTPQHVRNLGVRAVLVEPQDERGPLPIRQLRKRVQHDRRLRYHDVSDQFGEMRTFTTVPPMMRATCIHDRHAQVRGRLPDSVPMPMETNERVLHEILSDRAAASQQIGDPHQPLVLVGKDRTHRPIDFVGKRRQRCDRLASLTHVHDE